MRRIATIAIVATLAIAMMGAENPQCDKAKGRTPQPAEHDPAPHNKPNQARYRFRIQFATHPTRSVHYSYAFGDQGENNLAWDGPGRSVEYVVPPGTRLWLKVTSDAGALATYTCGISWAEPGQRPRVRAYFAQRGVNRCELSYTVREGEEDYPSL